MILTHGHGDHVADAIPVAKRTGCLVICNFEIGDWLTAQGVENVHQMHIGGGYNFDFGRVKLTIGATWKRTAGRKLWRQPGRRVDSFQ